MPVIRTEADALELLRTIWRDHTDFPVSDVRFEGWPTLTIHLTGDKYHQTITPSVMKGFVELQSSLLRSYATARYGEPRSNRLTDDERAALEFEVKVNGGSSDLKVDFNDFLSKMLELIGAKMEPAHLITMVAIIGVLYFGSDVLKKWLEERRLEREYKSRDETMREMISSQRFTSGQETQRLQIVQDIVASSSQYLNIARGAEDARAALVKSIRNADDAEIQGVSLDGDVAAELTRNLRRVSEDVRLDDTYRILRVDSSDPIAFKIKIFGMTNGVKLEATVQDNALTPEFRQIMQSAEWRRRPINLDINAKMIGDKYSNVTVLRIAEIPEDGARPH